MSGVDKCARCGRRDDMRVCGPCAAAAVREIDAEAEGDEREALVEGLTLAVMAHYGYTDADLAEAEAVHPGRVCSEDECYDEDGGTVHSPAWRDLGQTANLMVEVVEPYLRAAGFRRRDPDAGLRERVEAVGALADEDVPWVPIADLRADLAADTQGGAS